ncbi:MAG TPA: hypothetical protein VIL85_12665 [Thermomicrobiales bacterium]|jgi:hypothetical protein
MAEQPRPDDLAQLRATVVTLQTDLARLQRRRRLPRRFLPLALVALLVALLPLALLAASPFNDLTGGVHDANIEAIYTAGITRGCDPNVSYCPTELVTREEMASFLARTAGLGDNPPVANAKTAQTAVSAETATNAATAGNASTVGGLAPSGLVRVARGTGTVYPDEGAIGLTGTFTPVAQVQIAAPGAGFLLVTGSLSFLGVATGGSNSIEYRLRDTGPGGAPSVTSVTSVEPSVYQSGTATTVVAVPGAGTRTLVLEAKKTIPTSSFDATMFNGEITALFVPFGSAGGGALGAPEPPAADPTRLPGGR